MKNGLSLNLGLGGGFIAMKSEEINHQEEISSKQSETVMENPDSEDIHDEEHFLELSLRSLICEQEFSNAEESMRRRKIKRTLSVELGQIPEAISSSSNIKSSEAQSKNHMANNSSFGAEMTTEKEDGAARKKLRLSQDQAAFLEESFKAHSTLNPKQKLALAKQLNLRPRQVEVWFQNRRARTKLKKTEMDYEYLKRCCQMLTLENKRLQREVAELRLLRKNGATHPFYMHLNHSLCPSCRQDNISSSASVAIVTFNNNQPKSLAALLSKPGFGQIVTDRQ
ncbi:homeobox leucine zipper protein [Rhynchospora pubera]|uniref:Homeobox leucine zipper protein n=1 Tax=Rhynchospora pubera TaxID=906938 RepID=A0AAV8FT17_9POAL|nr:homeobox leucine zipper protein [Rhynchospora pubera]